jgi:hypothetical protein
METLLDIIKPITGHRRTFLLMRISGLDVDLSRQLSKVTKGTYNSWFKNDTFVGVHQKLPELAQNYRQEAIQLLRRDNQLEAVLLESKIVQKMKEEIESGEYVIIKTHLAREVYSKLMADLDAVPAVSVKSLSWSQRIQQIYTKPPDQIEGGTVDGEFEEVSEQSAEHSESQLLQEGQPTNDEATEKSEEAGV